jgi:hypothetical protein
VAVFALTFVPDRAPALERCTSTRQLIERLQFEGLSATAVETVQDLLPHPVPTRYSPLELEEFERRLNNLGIFDAVTVACDGSSLRILVREKWTLVPEVDFATGKTFADSYALLGLTEYNFLGTANQLGFSAYREQRGFGATLSFEEHGYQRRGWSLGAEASMATSVVRFEADGGWRTTSAALELSARSPPVLHEYLNYVAGFYGSSESVDEARGSAPPPPSTQVLQSFMGFSWDAYQWHDLVPSGVQTSLWLIVGGLFGEDPPLPRHSAEFLLRAALPLGHQLVLSVRTTAVLGTRGNANYGFVLGSVDGVRGLSDATYYNWAEILSNVELRQSFQLWPRWAIQLVSFSDAAAFEQMTVRGGRGDGNVALSLGLGVRIVPTWISSVALRLDASRLLAPESAWFTQLGLNQYF